MGSIPVRVIKKLLNPKIEELFYDPYEESKEHGRPQAAKKSPVGSFLVFGSQSSGMSTVVADVQVYILFDPYGNCNNDDRCLRQKQGVIVGAVASETRAPPKAQSL